MNLASAPAVTVKSRRAEADGPDDGSEVKVRDVESFEVGRGGRHMV